jgi:hypothetical protein
VQITEDNENSAHACKHCQMPFARSWMFRMSLQT